MTVQEIRGIAIANESWVVCHLQAPPSLPHMPGSHLPLPFPPKDSLLLFVAHGMTRGLLRHFLPKLKQTYAEADLRNIETAGNSIRNLTMLVSYYLHILQHTNF
jgi:hypothetical protein